MAFKTSPHKKPSTVLSEQDVRDLRLTENFHQWLVEFQLDAVDRDTLRTIIRSPLNDFLQSFCVPYVRSDIWVSTMRSNIDLGLGDFDEEESEKSNDVQEVVTDAEMEDLNKELEKLERCETSLLETVKLSLDMEAVSVSTRMQLEQKKLDKKFKLMNLVSQLKSKQLVNDLSRSFCTSNSQGSKEVLGPVKLEYGVPASQKDQKHNLCKTIKTFISSEDKLIEGVLDSNINMLKTLVQPDLRKLANLPDELLYRIREDEDNSMPELPAATFSNGLKEFIQIIYKKLIEWSHFQLQLHAQNVTNTTFCPDVCDSMLESTLNEQSTTLKQNTFLKLQIKEEKLRQILRFYQTVNPDEYTEQILSKDFKKCINNKQLSTIKSEDNYWSNVTLLESKLPPPFNYELLTEILLGVLDKFRTQVNDKMIWKEVTLESQMEEYLEAARNLLQKSIKGLQLENLAGL